MCVVTSHRILLMIVCWFVLVFACGCVMCCFCVFFPFSPRPALVWRVRCLHEWLCGSGGSGAIGIMPACISWCGVHSAAFCWRGVELRVLIFCTVLICGVQYRILENKECFFRLFILLVTKINILVSVSLYILSVFRVQNIWMYTIYFDGGYFASLKCCFCLILFFWFKDHTKENTHQYKKNV
jgi:hypothetical protein